MLVDRERIAHVFDNLIGNALAHTDRSGHVRIEAAARVSENNHNNGNAPGTAGVQFVVSDDGEGIPPDALSRIFERFFRVPGSRARHGVGLGLAITREIVEAHGGSIEVQSEPGRGTSFTIQLPCVHASSTKLSQSLPVSTDGSQS